MEIIYFIIILCFIWFSMQEKDIYEVKKENINLKNLNKKYENEIYEIKQKEINYKKDISKLNNNYEKEINYKKDILKLKQKLIIYENKKKLPPS